MCGVFSEWKVWSLYIFGIEEKYILYLFFVLGFFLLRKKLMRFFFDKYLKMFSVI